MSSNTRKDATTGRAKIARLYAKNFPDYAAGAHKAAQDNFEQSLKIKKEVKTLSDTMDYLKT